MQLNESAKVILNSMLNDEIGMIPLNDAFSFGQFDHVTEAKYKHILDRHNIQNSNAKAIESMRRGMFKTIRDFLYTEGFVVRSENKEEEYIFTETGRELKKLKEYDKYFTLLQTKEESEASRQILLRRVSYANLLIAAGTIVASFYYISEMLKDNPCFPFFYLGGVFLAGGIFGMLIWKLLDRIQKRKQ